MGRAERVVRWSLIDPIGWFILQVTLLLFAGGVVWVVDRAVGGDLSSGAQWGVFGAVALVLAVIVYLARRRYLEDLERARGGSEPEAS
jgi:hypothetical protein